MQRANKLWGHGVRNNTGARTCAGVLAICLVAILAESVAAQEAQWIWSAEHQKDDVPQGACHFRKTFVIDAPQSGEITIAADDSYELYVNGRSIGSGSSAKRLDKYDVSSHLKRGRNHVAVKVINSNGSTAALAVRVMVKEQGGPWRSHSTNASWKTSLRPLPLWNLPIYNDSRWAASQEFGALGSTVPWDRQEGVAVDEQQNHERFRIARQFRLQRIIGHENTGSLIAITFNEFGQVIAAREGGPLLLMIDSNDDNMPDSVRIYCDKVKNCQGILALNGDVYVTADGPDGQALYRLSDKDRDGTLEDVTTLLKFKGEMGEHGVHGLVLGPDGMIYIAIGNHTAPEKPYAESSPHRNYYEGDLITPRYEDPSGHAVGVEVPGGAIIRTDIDGNGVEIFAGGLRNAYDLAFNRDGDLFTHDSDMESDLGTPWYRPTQVFHVTAGAEFGWRSGWAKWPDYFPDVLPGILDTGRGSPAGAVVYNHHMFPTRYHDTLFLADWSEGRILAVHLKRSGASYNASSEVFLEGDPLNVTDLAVGPDGGLYFCTGGRGTSGGLYRISWQGVVPENVRNLGTPLTSIIRQPQLHSAWYRQNIAALKNQMGQSWDKNLLGVAHSVANSAHYRTRALELMQLFGPMPKPVNLVALSRDENELVRAKSSELMGIHFDTNTHARLIDLLSDSDRTVRRKALEALARASQAAPVGKLIASLTSDDRFESWAARRLLERTPVDQWRDLVLTTDDHRLFIQGSLALLIAHGNNENALAVIDRFTKLMDDFITDENFIDMLRLVQVAAIRGEVTPDDRPQFRENLVQEFPSGSGPMNRELVRLLTYFQASSIMDRYLIYLEGPAPDVEKLHLALHLRFIQSGFSSQQRLQLLKFYDTARHKKGGGSYSHYVMNATRDFAKTFSPEDSRLVLAGGARWPDAALGALYKLPASLDEELLGYLKEMDRQIADESSEAIDRLKVGVVAVLARSGDEQSFAYLREIWQRDPERRQAVAMGLAQQPDGENWELLLRSLPVLEEGAAVEVLERLRSVDRQPDEPEHYRQVILRGLYLKENGAQHAVALLESWTGLSISDENDSWQTALAAWQKWFSDEHPELPDAKLPVAVDTNKWKYDELLEYLTGEQGAHGSAQRGAAVFAKGQCSKCHRFGDTGESMGPDLTSLGKRFMKKEILESIIYPSHVISDQYAAKNILTTDGRQIVGIAAPTGSGEIVVLDSSGKKIVLAEDDVDEMTRSKASAMPSELLDTLTLAEIADLFAYLQNKQVQNVARRPTVTEAQQ